MVESGGFWPVVGTKRLAAIIAAAGLGVLALLYGVLYAFTGGKVPGDTTVLGVQLGGLSKDEAKARLSDALKSKVGEPVRLSANGKTYAIRPSTAGLTVDVGATIDKTGAGRSLNPARIWTVLTGGSAIEPVVAADEHKLKATAARLSKQVGQAPTEGSITFENAKATQHPPAEGIRLDTEVAAEAIKEAFPAGGDPTPLEISKSEPKVNAEALAKAMKEYAEPAMSGPVKLTVGDNGVLLRPEQIAPALSLTVNSDGSYTPKLDMAKLEPVIAEEFKGVEVLPKDATVVISGGRPTVVPSVDGKVVARDKVMPAILGLLPKPEGERHAAVELTAKKAELTTEAAQKLGIKEVVGEFTTYFPHADYRNINIGTAASRINGALLRPGDIFSLNKLVGERTKENGFAEGWIINHGVLEKDLGGGVSQSATTTFNAMFFAGFKDVQHKPHSFYISRYPEGREATVAWPSLDMKFQDDSPYGALVETSFHRSSPGNRGSITVRIWSTKVWDITAGKSARYNIKQAGVIYDTSEKCETHAPEEGFDVKVYRYFAKNGQRVRTETFHTHYNPADKVVCGPKPTTPPPTTPPPTTSGG
jgi:vancomycin resistance protein YoaR